MNRSGSPDEPGISIHASRIAIAAGRKIAWIAMPWDDRRQARRTPCSLAVRLREPDGKYRLNWLFDISCTGAGALVFVPIDEATIYGEIVVGRSGEVYPFQADLMWAKYDVTPAKIGLQFRDLSPDLQTWLNVLYA